MRQRSGWLVTRSRRSVFFTYLLRDRHRGLHHHQRRRLLAVLGRGSVRVLGRVLGWGSELEPGSELELELELEPGPGPGPGQLPDNQQ